MSARIAARPAAGPARSATAPRHAPLPDGQTHYRWDGPPHGPPVLLVHGATVPGWQFDYLVPELCAAGLRTLRIDLYGHGLSARPHFDYGLERFIGQTGDLLDHLRLHTPIAALGHSMGAAVLAGLAARQPQRFSRLLLVAPLLDFTANSPLSRLLDVPALGELLMHLYVVPMLARRRRARYRALGDGELVARFREQIRLPGYHQALLSMFRSGALGDQSAHYAALARHCPRTLVLYGETDTITTHSQVAQVCSLLGGVALRCYPGLGHNLLMTHARTLGAEIAGFLLGNSDATANAG